jgi:hypothetical protein
LSGDIKITTQFLCTDIEAGQQRYRYELVESAMVYRVVEDGKRERKIHTSRTTTLNYDS